jgi:hypothetical protein
MVLLRNSSDPTIVVGYSADEWRAFLRGVKAGEFDELGCHPAGESHGEI